MFRRDNQDNGADAKDNKDTPLRLSGTSGLRPPPTHSLAQRNAQPQSLAHEGKENDLKFAVNLLEQLLKQCRQLKAENLNLKDKLKRKAADNDSATKEAEKFKSEGQLSLEQDQRLQNRAWELEMKLNELQVSFDNQQQLSRQLSEDYAKLVAALDMLQSENEELRKKLSQWEQNHALLKQQTQAQIEQLNTKISDLNDECDQLKLRSSQTISTRSASPPRASLNIDDLEELDDFDLVLDTASEVPVPHPDPSNPRMEAETLRANLTNANRTILRLRQAALKQRQQVQLMLQGPLEQLSPRKTRARKLGLFPLFAPPPTKRGLSPLKRDLTITTTEDHDKLGAWEDFIEDLAPHTVHHDLDDELVGLGRLFNFATVTGDALIAYTHTLSLDEDLTNDTRLLRERVLARKALQRRIDAYAEENNRVLIPYDEYDALKRRASTSVVDAARAEGYYVLTQKEYEDLQEEEGMRARLMAKGLVTIPQTELDELRAPKSLDDLIKLAEPLGFHVVSSTDLKSLQSPLRDALTRHANLMGYLLVETSKLEELQAPSPVRLAELARGHGQVLLSKEEYSDFTSPTKTTLENHAREINHVLLPTATVDALQSPLLEVLADHASSHDHRLLTNDQYSRLVNPTRDDVVRQASQFNLELVATREMESLRQRVEDPGEEAVKRYADGYGLITMTKKDYTDIYSKAHEPDVEHLKLVANRFGKVLVAENDFNELKRDNADLKLKLESNAKELEQQGVNLAVANEKYTKLLETAAQKSEEIDRLTGALQQANTEHASSKTKHVQEIESLRDAHSKALSAIKEDLTQSHKRELAAAVVKAASESKTKAIGEADVKHAETLQTIKAEHATALENLKTGHSKKMEEFQSENLRLKTSLHQEMERYTQLQDSFNAITAKHDKASSDFASLQKSHQELTESHALKSSQLGINSKQLAEVSTKLEAMVAEKDVVQRNLADATAETVKVKEELENCTARLSDFEKRHEALTQENSVLETKLQLSLEQIVSLQQKVDDTLKESHTLSERLESLGVEHDSLVEKLKKQESENDVLNEKLVSLESQRDQASKDHLRVSDHLKSIQEDRDSLNTKLDLVEKLHKEVTAAYNEAKEAHAQQLAEAQAPKSLEDVTKDLVSRGMVVLSASEHEKLTQPPLEEVMRSTASMRKQVILTEDDWKHHLDQVGELKETVSQLQNPSVDDIEKYAKSHDRVVLTSEDVDNLKNPLEEQLVSIGEARGMVVIAKRKYAMLESLAQSPSLLVVQKHADRLGQVVLSSDEAEKLRFPLADQVARRAREVGMVALPEKEVKSLRAPLKATVAERARDLNLVCIESDEFLKIKQQAEAPLREEIEGKAQAMGLVTVPTHKYDQLKARAEQPTLDQLEEHARELHTAVVITRDEYERLHATPSAEQLSAHAADIDAVVVPKDKWHFVQLDAYVTQKAAENGNVVLSKGELEHLTRPRTIDDIEKEASKLDRVLISPNELTSLKQVVELPSLEYLKDKLNAMQYEVVAAEDYAKLISPALIEEQGLLLVPQAEYDDYKQRVHSPTVEQLVALSSGLDMKLVSQKEFDSLTQLATNPTLEQVTRMALLMNLELVASEQISQWKQAADQPSWEALEAAAAKREMVIVPKDDYDTPLVDRLKLAALARGMAVVNSADYAATLRRAHSPDVKFLSTKAAAQGMVVISQKEYDLFVDPLVEHLATLAEKHHMTLVSQTEHAQVKAQLEEPPLEYLEDKARQRGQKLVTEDDYQYLVNSRLPTYLELEAKQRGLVLVKAGTVDVLEEQEKNLREELDHMTQKLDSLRLELKRKLDALNQLLQHEKLAKDDLAQKFDQAQDAARELSLAKDELKVLKEKLADSETEIGRKVEEVNAAKKDLEDSRNQLQSFRKELENGLKELQTHKETLVNYKTTIDDQNSQIKALKDEKSSLESKIASLELSQTTLEDKLGQMQSLSKSIEDNEAKIVELTLAKNRIEEDNAKLTSQNLTLEELMQLLKQELSNLDANKSKLLQEKQDWTNDKSELNAKINLLEGKLAAMQSEKDSQSSTLAAAQDELRQLKSDFDTKVADLVASHDAKIRGVVGEHEARVKDLSVTHDAQLKSLTADHTLQAGELEKTYKDQLEANAREIDAMKSQLATVDKELSASKSQLQSEATTYAELQKELEDCQQELDEARQHASKLDAVALEREKTVKDADISLKEANDKLALLETELNEVRDRYGTQVANLETELSRFKDPEHLTKSLQLKGLVAVSEPDYNQLRELAHSPTVDHLVDKATNHDMALVSTKELDGLRNHLQKFEGKVPVPKDEYERLSLTLVEALREKAEEHNMCLIDTNDLAALKKLVDEPLEDRARTMEKKVVSVADYDKLVLKATQPLLQDVNEHAAKYGMTVLDVADYKKLKEMVDKPITQRASEMGYVALSKAEFEQLSARFDHPLLEYLQTKSKERKLAMVPESEYQHLKSEAERDVKAKAAERGMVAIPAAELDELHRQAAKDVHARASEENMVAIRQDELDSLRQDAHKTVHQRARDLGLVVLLEAEVTKLRADASKDIHQRARDSQLSVLEDGELARLRAAADDAAKTRDALELLENQKNELQKRVDDFTKQMEDYNASLDAIKQDLRQYLILDLELLAKEHHMVVISEADAARLKRSLIVLLTLIDNFKDANDTFVLLKDELRALAEQQGLVLMTQDEVDALTKKDIADPKEVADNPPPTRELVAALAKQLGLVTVSKLEYQRTLGLVDQLHDRQAVVQSARKMGLLAVPELAFVPTTVQRAPDLSNVTLIPTTYYNKLSRNDALCIEKVTDDVFRKYAEKRGYTKVSGTAGGSNPLTPSGTKVTPIMELLPTMQNQSAHPKFTPPQPLAKSTRQVTTPLSSGSLKFFCGLLPALDLVRLNLSLAADLVRTTGMLSMATTALFTDKLMMPAITQVMMGEYLFKYYRPLGLLMGLDSRHERYFWVHPYSVTLYWLRQNPILHNPAEIKTRAVAILDVKLVEDNNPYPTGLYHKLIIVYSPNRQIKITCALRQRHNMWYNALRYLIHRNMEELSFDRDEQDEFNNPLSDENPEANDTIELLHKRHEFLMDMGERHVLPRQNLLRLPRLPHLLSRGNSYRK